MTSNSPNSTFDSISLTGQLVLVEIATRERNDETPVRANEIRKPCKRRLNDLEMAVAGQLSEADIVRSLYRLEDAGLVTEIDAEVRSPTGKGRPAYTLGCRPETVYEGVDEAIVRDGHE
ncbi:hypothetical protein ACLI4Z_02875 [Natrialbaceae archaeon A-arb3/5]